MRVADEVSPFISEKKRMSYWIVACGTSGTNKDMFLDGLKARLTRNQKLVEEIHLFDVPESMKFGSFDSLIKLVDELTKYDSQIESVVRRVERQWQELDRSSELCIHLQRSQVPVKDYIDLFKWDDMKFPRGRSIQDNIQSLLNVAQKVDEEIKNNIQAFTDAKQQANLFSKKDQVSHMQRDLVDLLTPNCVEDSDFVYSEHLTTLIVVIPRGCECDFITNYESFDKFVVPESGKRIAPDDKEGNSIWRVVMFKSACDAFKASARQNRFLVRDFSYDKGKYQEIMNSRTASETELRRQEGVLSRVCQIAFSDVFVAWTHLKAIRIFVEAVLRYGVPPAFGAYILKPGRFASRQSKLKSELLAVFCDNTEGLSGQSAIQADVREGQQLGNEEEGNEYYPYILVPFTPLSGSKV